jgi:hypothetical protein
MKRLSNQILIVFALLLPFSAAFAVPPLMEQSGTENSGFVPVMTRWVKIFLEMETELDQAVRQGNQVRINKLVKDDFEQRTGFQPGLPIPREDWLKEYFLHARDIPPLIIEQMAARDLGETIVVSFKWAERNKAGLFVIDIWERQREGWVLAARYVDRESLTNSAIPGVPFEQKVFPKKY